MIRKLVMTTITILSIVCLLCPSVQANQQTKNSVSKNSVSNVKQSIVKNSIKLGIDPALALSIARRESGFKHDTRSSNGAVGVFQLMPSTAERLGVNPYYLSDNIKGGLMYYKRMYNMFGSTELALAAYNAGPAVVKKYKQVPPYGETRSFVYGILADYHRQKKYPDPAIRQYKQNSHTVTSKHYHKAYKEMTSKYVKEHYVAKENVTLSRKVLAKNPNVKFELVKKI